MFSFLFYFPNQLAEILLQLIKTTTDIGRIDWQYVPTDATVRRIAYGIEWNLTVWLSMDRGFVT